MVQCDITLLYSTVDHSSHCTTIETCQQCSCLQSLLRPGHHQSYGILGGSSLLCFMITSTVLGYGKYTSQTQLNFINIKDI